MESVGSEDAAPAATLYDAIHYPGYPRIEAHPAIIAAVAKRYGLDPPPVDACTVLEIGCGDGAHLLPMAVAFPGSRFTGIDLSPSAVAMANETASALNLQNTDFRVINLLEIEPDFGSFDFIIVHGLYSWIPALVREKLMSVCKRNLTPGGLVYISYNALPGCHTRLMIREMMLFHLQNIENPRERIDQARAFVRFLAAANPEGTPYRKVLDDVLESSDAAIFHDDLAPVNEPVYFYQFYQHAMRYELQYVGDANWIETRDRSYSPEIRSQLVDLESRDFLMKSQYLDFLKNRRFRRSILCHAGLPLDRSLKPSVLDDFYISGTLADTDGPDGQVRSRDGETITLSHPLVSAALDILRERDERPIRFRQLMAEASARAGVGFDDPHLLAEMFLYLCAAQFIRFFTHCPAVADEPEERPIASPLARLQARASGKVSNLMQLTIDLKETLPRFLLPALDGTRDRDALKRDLTIMFRKRGATLARGGEPMGDTDDLIQRLDTEMDRALKALARHALLLRGA